MQNKRKFEIVGYAEDDTVILSDVDRKENIMIINSKDAESLALKIVEAARVAGNKARYHETFEMLEG